MCDNNIRIVFLKSGFISGGFCSTLKDYDHATNKVRISRTEDCEMHEKRVYASRESSAKRKILNSFVKIRGEGDKHEEI